MSGIDWAVLIASLTAVTAYGVWKTRGAQSAESHLRGGNDGWITVGLSVMATQASAITFLSGPGQSFTDGMGFVQMYLGLPLAMIVVSAVMVPAYFRLRVYTAYEYLEQRFDLRIRLLTAALFFIQRGVSAGITIYAPAILLAAVLGWPLAWMNALIGIGVIVYTVSGGSRAVSQTQKQQMAVILVGMIVAAGFLIASLPVGVDDAAAVAGATGRMNVIDFHFDPRTRYNIWSGLIGGFFLQLSYFGTDQSQVQRYLAASSVVSSRMGLMFNALLKIPMQLCILFVGILLYAHYVFHPSPMIFDEPLAVRAESEEFEDAQARWDQAWSARRAAAERFVEVRGTDDEPSARDALAAADHDAMIARDAGRAIVAAAVPDESSQDGDFVFLHFILHALPVGIVGLLMAVLIAAAMSATASELTALGATSTIDFYKRLVKPDATDAEALFASRVFTALWGVFALAFATYATLFDNLIEAVNILGSVFYGPILGIFMTAFLLPSVGAKAVFRAAIASQLIVFALWARTDLAFLWYNAIGCLAVMGIALALRGVSGTSAAPRSDRPT